jgi:hypothetical protein
VTKAAPSYDVCGTFALQNEQAVGWCWSQERPGEALRVEILSDGQVVARGIAARLVLEVVRPGVTDGYHGYLLILPKGLPQTAILEAREAQTGKIFARHIPKTLPDVMAWQERVAQLADTVAQLHNRLGQSGPGEARWSAAWGASGALLDRKTAKGRRVGLSTGIALRPIAEPLRTVILDLPRVGHLDEATARREVMQLAPLLSAAQAELVVIDDGRAAGFLTGVAGLRYAGVPNGAGDVERLTVALGMARGLHVAIFAPVRVGFASPGAVPDTLRGRAALLSGPPTDTVVVGGGVAAAIRGAGLNELAPLVERAAAETGMLLMARRVLCGRVRSLDPRMDDGADLALLDFALSARAAGLAVRVFEEALLSLRRSDLNTIRPRGAFLQRWWQNKRSSTALPGKPRM